MNTKQSAKSTRQLEKAVEEYVKDSDRLDGIAYNERLKEQSLRDIKLVAPFSGSTYSQDSVQEDHMNMPTNFWDISIVEAIKYLPQEIVSQIKLAEPKGQTLRECRKFLPRDLWERIKRYAEGVNKKILASKIQTEKSCFDKEAEQDSLMKEASDEEETKKQIEETESENSEAMQIDLIYEAELENFLLKKRKRAEQTYSLFLEGLELSTVEKDIPSAHQISFIKFTNDPVPTMKRLADCGKYPTAVWKALILKLSKADMLPVDDPKAIDAIRSSFMDIWSFCPWDIEENPKTLGKNYELSAFADVVDGMKFTFSPLGFFPFNQDAQRPPQGQQIEEQVKHYLKKVYEGKEISPVEADIVKCLVKTVDEFVISYDEDQSQFTSDKRSIFFTQSGYQYLKDYVAKSVILQLAALSEADEHEFPVTYEFKRRLQKALENLRVEVVNTKTTPPKELTDRLGKIRIYGTPINEESVTKRMKTCVTLYLACLYRKIHEIINNSIAQITKEDFTTSKAAKQQYIRQSYTDKNIGRDMPNDPLLLETLFQNAFARNNKWLEGSSEEITKGFDAFIQSHKSPIPEKVVTSIFNLFKNKILGYNVAHWSWLIGRYNNVNHYNNELIVLCPTNDAELVRERNDIISRMYPKHKGLKPFLVRNLTITHLNMLKQKVEYGLYGLLWLSKIGPGSYPQILKLLQDKAASCSCIFRMLKDTDISQFKAVTFAELVTLMDKHSDYLHQIESNLCQKQASEWMKSLQSLEIEYFDERFSDPTKILEKNGFKIPQESIEAIKLDWSNYFPDNQSYIPLTWQVKTIAAASNRADQHKFQLYGCATGTGKSCLIAGLAMHLKGKGKRVSVITSTRFLKQQLEHYYFRQEVLFGDNPISLLSADDLFQLEVKALDVLIVDEFDSMTGLNQCQTNMWADSQGNFMFGVVSMNDILNRATTIIAFCPSASVTVTAALPDAMRASPMVFNLGNTRMLDNNNFNVTYHHKAYDGPHKKLKQIALYTEKVIKEDPEMPVYVILSFPREVDEFVREWKSKSKFPLFSLEQAQTLTDFVALKKPSPGSGGFVFVTSATGGRGLDVKGDKNGHVIIAAPIANYLELVQYVGRAQRSQTGTPTEATIFSTTGFDCITSLMQADANYVGGCTHLVEQLPMLISGAYFKMSNMDQKHYFELKAEILGRFGNQQAETWLRDAVDFLNSNKKEPALTYFLLLLRGIQCRIPSASLKNLSVNASEFLTKTEIKLKNIRVSEKDSPICVLDVQQFIQRGFTKIGAQF